MTDIKAPLIDHLSSTSFKITQKELCDLFQPDHIRDGESVKKLCDYNGIQGLASLLKTSLKNGIDSSQQSLLERQKAFGINEQIVKPSKTLWELIIGQFEDKILRILCAASLVSLIVGVIEEGLEQGWLEGFAIFVAVIIIVSVTSINDYMKDKQFRKLNQQAERRNVNVVRDGKVENISIFSLLVGDLMQIETGEIFPVDGVLIKGNNLICDESSITGESDPIKKQPYNHPEKPAPFLVSGSKVIEGSGEMLISAVGVNSQNGKLKLRLQEEDDDVKTPLQEKLDVLADEIGKIGITCATLTFCAMIVNLMISNYLNGYSIIQIANIEDIVGFFIIAVTIVVVAVPEGLPLAVTIALAYSVGKMKEENNLVRFLEACETMGGAHTICSDKTGTLTQNKMKVTRLFAQENIFSEFQSKDFQKKILNYLCEGQFIYMFFLFIFMKNRICINSNAFPKISEIGKFEQIGNKTECALLQMAYEFGFDFNKYRPSENIIKIIPFSSSRKRMSTVYKSQENTIRVYTKGAPDLLLPLCCKYVNKFGEEQYINEEYIGLLKSNLKKFADASLRTILIAYKEYPASQMTEQLLSNDENLESDLIILGLTGIQDPLRPGISEAVSTCRAAGITVRMVTGDNLDTAIAISKEAGIIAQDFNVADNPYTVMEGKYFRQLVGGIVSVNDKVSVGNLDKFKEIAPHLRVLARSSPDDKYLLVTGFKQCGQVVAVTGDGTNDAPALKKADIGFAMGIAGTEIAKEASGIIILDDNFSSIITSIKWGRNIFECIRKFLQFQVTVNIVAMFMAFMGGVILRESPLNSIQMLWVNLIMDTLASLALATESPNMELLKRKPISRTEPMINALMWRNIICHGVYQIIVLTIILFYGPDLFDISSSIHAKPWNEENGIHYTIFFNVFVYLQVFNEINARKLKREEKNVFVGFFNNSMFLFVIFGTIIVQMTIIEIGGKAVKCAPLTTSQNITCIFIGLSSLLVGFIIKLIPVGFFNTCKLLSEEPPKNVPFDQQGTIRDIINRPSQLRARSSLRQSIRKSQRVSQSNSQKQQQQQVGGHKVVEMKQYN
ncbi:hypothetical protein IMG5_164760 [Ichthyophthirius multifiliis]|uniref:Calcium-transporting ATPase n=1 Tax=Ichthyophthirius multifiliis TaxID=5932 RepID=G0R0J2_ICHMU|nr:hypothetical protein IMG5_164760 [Ichthyophthirius multifiliis]EGR29017.1 hypothetical protein IMG5_164760 [Ichthyophthirius multifiliis]|eukprot:XP_004030253.1 hypothetical protein IMG5_164760 [Ichthyophthirius multifiliis]